MIPLQKAQAGRTLRGIVELPSQPRTDTRPASDDDGDGEMVASFDPVPPNHFDRIERVAIVARPQGGGDFTNTPDLRVYVGSGNDDEVTRDENLRDSTTAGDIDTADMFQPIYVPEGSRVVIEWTGGDANMVGVANLQITRYTFVPVVG